MAPCRGRNGLFFSMILQAVRAGTFTLIPGTCRTTQAGQQDCSLRGGLGQGARTTFRIFKIPKGKWPPAEKFELSTKSPPPPPQTKCTWVRPWTG